MKLKALLFLIPLIVSCGSSGTDQVVSARENVIIIEGQSNSLDIGSYNVLKPPPVPVNCRYVNVGEDQGGWGVERYLMTQLPTGRRWLIIKWGKSATTIAEWESELYEQSYDAIQGVLSGYPDYEIIAFIWMHGESDSNRDSAFGYYDGLVWLYSQVVSDYNDPGFIYNLTDKWWAVNIDVVREAQFDFHDDYPETYLVDVSDASKREDGTHYDELGLMLIGTRFGKIIAGF